jgi:hypothetical protein
MHGAQAHASVEKLGPLAPHAHVPHYRRLCHMYHQASFHTARADVEKDEGSSTLHNRNGEFGDPGRNTLS